MKAILAVWVLLLGALVVAATSLPAPAQVMTGVSNFVHGTSGGGGAYAGPGDIVSGWAFWGGLRAFSAATAGTKSANICNSGDANCADVNTLANGDFDVATAQATPLNCGGTGGTCTVKTLYDKSGNARDITQATIGNRPTLVFSCLGSLPCMAITTSSNMLSTVTVSASAPVSASAVVEQTATPVTNSIIGDDIHFTSLEFNNTGIIETFCGSAGIVQNAADNSFHAMQGVCASGANAASISADGTTTPGTLTPAGLGGGHVRFGIGITGKIAEGGLWLGAFTAGNISSLNSNQHTYWGF